MDISGVKVLESADDIQERRQQVLDRYRRFKELSVVRRQKLEDSYRFQFFRRDADELEKWIQEKLQIASDENYKDPSNLQVRLKISFISTLSEITLSKKCAVTSVHEVTPPLSCKFLGWVCLL